MKHPDIETIRTLLDWQRAGHSVDLVTVVNTWGSAPRPPGSIAAVRDDGAVVGSVSGGCIERQLAESRRNDSTVSEASLVVGDEAARAVGLTCGGRLELVFERVVEDSGLNEVLQALEQRRRVLRETHLSSGSSQLRSATASDSFSWNGEHLRRVFGPDWRILLIGAGELSQHVARMALMLDFDVLVCEPRPPFRDAYRVDGTTLIDELPDDAVKTHASDARSAVLALTHEPSLDDLALEEAVSSDCFYIGALGSRRSHDKRLQRLLAQGQSEAALKRIHAPIGLDIASRTAAEIGVSIAAELVQVRAQQQIA